MKRVDAPAECCVERDDDLRQREDRVCASMWVGAVRGRSLDRDLDGIEGGIDRSLVQRHLSPWQLWMYVGGEHRSRAKLAERLLGDHLSARRVGLLARLEDGEQRRGQALSQRMGGPCQGD